MRLFAALLTLNLMLAGVCAAQQQTASSKTRPNHNANATGTELGVKPDKVLRIAKLKGVIEDIDLQARTVTVDPDGSGKSLKLTFR